MIYIVTFICTVISLSIYFQHLTDYKIYVKGFKRHEIQFTLIKFLLVFWAPLFLGAFRYGIGTDYDSYLGFFKLQSVNDINTTSYTGMEFAFRFITKCISYITDNSIFYFGFFMFFTLFFFFLFCMKEEKKIAVGYLVLFYLCVLYGMSYNVMRQALAISIYIYALHFYLRDEMVKYIFVVLCAATFHISALIMIPCYFVKFLYNNKGNIKKQLKTIFIIVVIIVVINYKDIISWFSRYKGYLSGDGDRLHYSAILYFLEKLIFIIPVFIYRRKLDERYRSLLYIVFLDLMLLIPTLEIEYLYRMTYFFLPIYGILSTHLINEEENKKARRFYKGYYVIFYVSYFFLHYIYLGNHGIYPYVGCFEGGLQWIN